MTDRDDRRRPTWPAHLQHERTTTSLGRGASAGLATTALALAALIGVAWTGTAASPATPPTPQPVATER